MERGLPLRHNDVRWSCSARWPRSDWKRGRPVCGCGWADSGSRRPLPGRAGEQARAHRGVGDRLSGQTVSTRVLVAEDDPKRFGGASGVGVAGGVLGGGAGPVARVRDGARESSSRSTPRFLAVWVIHEAVGCAVAPRTRMRLLACSITTSAYRWASRRNRGRQCVADSDASASGDCNRADAQARRTHASGRAASPLRTMPRCRSNRWSPSSWRRPASFTSDAPSPSQASRSVVE